MIAACLDIGTNTILLTVMDLESGKLLTDQSEMARLGEGLQASGIIQETAIGRMEKILEGYVKTGEALGVARWFPIATSAMRDAKNSSEVIERIKSKFDMDIRIISGDEEAELTFFGGLHGLKLQNNQSVGLIDIGGGSTEFIIGTPDGIENKRSLNIGTVRFSELFNLHDSNPENFNLSEFRLAVQKALHSLPFSPLAETTWVAVAGTPTSLSAALHNLHSYESDIVHGSVLQLSWLMDRVHEFSRIPPTEILVRYPIFGKRYDLMLAGTMILSEALKWAGATSVLVSDHGLRYGVLNRLRKGQ